MNTPEEIEIIPPGQATDLQTIEKLTPSVIFSEGGSKALIDKIRQEVTTILPDISTIEGRKAIASLAYKVAQSKTLLDKMGQTLNADLKKQAKIIDNQRAYVWDELEAIQKAVRAPLTEWEQAEEKRTTGHADALIALENLYVFTSIPNAEEIQQRIYQLEVLSSRDWEEHAEIANSRIGPVRDELNLRLSQRKKYDEDQAELDRLRKEAAQRAEDDRCREEEAAKKERDRLQQEAIATAAAKAAEDAKAAEAEKLRQAEAARIQAEENEKKAAEEAKTQRARDAEAAERRAQEAAADATRKEQERVAAEAKKEEDERLRREANRKHCAEINNKVLDALGGLGVPPPLAKAIVEAIALEKISHTKISY